MTSFNKLKNLLFFIMVAGLVLLTRTPVQAVTFGFDCITNNITSDCNIGEAQLSVDVTDVADVFSDADGIHDRILFTFSNEGSNASSITGVYFDDGTLLQLSTIVNSAGVAFSQLTKPGNLPGGNPIDFVTTAGFSADSDPAVQPNGVNPGETLGIYFDLLTGVSYNDTLSALITPTTASSLRIGIHVQGFNGGGSESFVNNNPVPEPGTLLLMGLGLLGLTVLKRKK